MRSPCLIYVCTSSTKTSAAVLVVVCVIFCRSKRAKPGFRPGLQVLISGQTFQEEKDPRRRVRGVPLLEACFFCICRSGFLYAVMAGVERQWCRKLYVVCSVCHALVTCFFARFRLAFLLCCVACCARVGTGCRLSIIPLASDFENATASPYPPPLPSPEENRYRHSGNPNRGTQTDYPR